MANLLPSTEETNQNTESIGTKVTIDASVDVQEAIAEEGLIAPPRPGIPGLVRTLDFLPEGIEDGHASST